MLRALLVASALALFVHDHSLCRGFLPENDLYISVADPDAGGIQEREFHAILDQIEAFYTPIVAAHGGRLVVNREWSNGTVNASANRSGNTYRINMYGGLARHPAITKDAYMLVACHEMGHHLGGAPKIDGWMDSWATNEGGADYFASLRCLRRMFLDADNLQFVQQTQIDPVLRTKCEETYGTQAEEYLCMRVGMAGYDAANLFHVLKNTPEAVAFATPDPHVVHQMDDDHPAPQCRLDTYYQGGICRHDSNIELSDVDATLGTCNESTGQRDGLRPRCWYVP